MTSNRHLGWAVLCCAVLLPVLWYRADLSPLNVFLSLVWRRHKGINVIQTEYFTTGCERQPPKCACASASASASASACACARVRVRLCVCVCVCVCVPS